MEKEPYRPKLISAYRDFFLILTMIGLACAMEGLLATSRHHIGFYVPENIENLEHKLIGLFPRIKDADSVNKFLASFLPPLGFLAFIPVLTASCQSIKVVQPLISLGKRRPSEARDSILLDYANQNQFLVVWSSIRRGHLVVTMASIVALISYIFQPLAGSLIQISATRMVNNNDYQATAAGLLEPAPQSLTLPTAFLAAAGFDSVNMISTGLLPPFVIRGGDDPSVPAFYTGRWVVPPFQLLGNLSRPDDVMLANIYVQSQALYIEGGCAMARDVVISNSKGNATISGSISTTCEAQLSVVADNGTWYGTAQSADPRCATAINPMWDAMPSSLNSSSWPVVFGFARGTSKSMAFCVARQSVQNETAASYVQGNMMWQVNNTKPSSPEVYALNGVDLRGLAFQNPDSDSRTIGYLLADSVIRGAGIDNGVLVNTVYQDEQLAGDITSQCLNSYLDYLATLALRLYVYPSGGNSNVSAILETYADRIHVFPPVAHTLTALLIFSAFLLIAISIATRRWLRKKYLRVHNIPGTIAAAAVLLHESQLFQNTDIKTDSSLNDVETILKKTKFQINEETWKIETLPQAV